MQKFTFDVVECPECASPAEVVERFVLESTDGPIEHAIVLCVLRHRFINLVERLVSPRLHAPERGTTGPGLADVADKADSRPRRRQASP